MQLLKHLPPKGPLQVHLLEGGPLVHEEFSQIRKMSFTAFLQLKPLDNLS